MSKLVAVAFILASTSLVAPLPVIATSAVAVQCAETAAEGLKRPGGFCDLRSKTDTLAPPVSAPATEQAAPVANPCPSVAALPHNFRWLPRGARVLVAGC